MAHLNSGINLKKLILLAVVTLGSSCLAQPVPVYYQFGSSGFGDFESSTIKMGVAVVKPLGAATEEVRTDTTGVERRLKVQRLTVLDAAGQPSRTLVCLSEVVVSYVALSPNDLPIGGRFAIVYALPKSGKVMLNTFHSVEASEGEVAGHVAIPTAATTAIVGTTTPESYFGTFAEAVSTMGLDDMIEIFDKVGHPPGMRMEELRPGQRYEMTPFLLMLSQRFHARGGLFDVLFHARLAYFGLLGSTDALIDALLANKLDERVQTVLEDPNFDCSGFYSLDTKIVKYEGHKTETQTLLMEGAKTCKSGMAAALMARMVFFPLRDATKQDFLSLLLRDKPDLQAAVCNILAFENRKPERNVPVRKDSEGWEARVAAMAQLWLHEYGVGG